jgi:putative aminopeptidase FrvX
LDLLWKLLQIDSPAGDEGAMADWLVAEIETNMPSVRVERIGDSVIAVRGKAPTVAVFAHIDTIGFTLGYDRNLIRIGGPAPKDGVALRIAGGDARGKLRVGKAGGWKLGGKANAEPGTRWVYAAEPKQSGDEITSPYLDNRAGVWAALQTLTRCENVAVAFTAGEEHSGHGALVCARRLYEGYAIYQALISDITWDTKHVHCGDGVAISLRDSMTPRQRYLERILALAEVSGVKYQREIESSGGSDGGYIQRSGFPIDWVFVGAPEKHPHTSAERVRISDLNAMADMLVSLVNGLHVL